MHMPGHSWRTLLLLRRWWSETWSSLPSACHNALEEVGRTVTDCGWWRLRGTLMWARGCTAALLEFVTEPGYLGFVPGLW